MGAQPGWYRDTTMVNTQRFWDGERWTDQTQPLEASTEAAVFSGVLKVAALVAAIILAFVVIYQFAHSGDDLKCATRNAQHAQNGEPLEDCGD